MASTTPVAVGGVFEIYTLDTVGCINGKYGHVRIHASGVALGAGIPVSISGGSVEFEDGLSEIDPYIFEGIYMKVGYGMALGGGIGGGIVRLGGASASQRGATSNLEGLSPSPIGGVDLSYVGVLGYAHLAESPIVRSCRCD